MKKVCHKIILEYDMDLKYEPLTCFKIFPVNHFNAMIF
jgi:hypothetical protein